MTASARFPAQLHRLKTALNVAEDREVAAALGMTPTALALRKRRDAFPEEQLISLAASRPELRLDIVFIVTGARQGGLESLLIRGDITRLEQAELRASRDAYMARLGECAERMSLSSLHTLAVVAERIAKADSTDTLSAPGYTQPVASTLATTGEAPDAARHRSKGAKR